MLNKLFGLKKQKNHNSDQEYCVKSSLGERYKCKCCGYFTMTEKPLDPNGSPGTFEICPVCFWEDDSLQYLDPDRSGGANKVSLNEAKENYRNYGAVEKDMLQYVRAPRDYEQK